MMSKMKMVPLLRCKNMQEAISFYTHILDFELKDKEASPDDLVINLINEDAELQLTSLDSDQKPDIAVNVRVDDVDALFGKYLERGLQIINKENSPVHRGPLDQTWGMREFYVDDPSGNTLRFGQPIH